MDELWNCSFLLYTVVITKPLDKFVFTTLTHVNLDLLYYIHFVNIFLKHYLNIVWFFYCLQKPKVCKTVFLRCMLLSLEFK